MKIGIMGGTFNPIHHGHLLIGEYARTSRKLDKIIYIPTGRPVTKRDKLTLDPEIRYELLALALEDNPKFSISRMEIDRGGISYTIDTMRELRKTYREEEIYFIIGEDCLYHLDNWKDFQELKTLCKFLIFRRGLESMDYIEARILDLRKTYGLDIEFLESPIVEISSTEIRTRIKENLSIKYLVPLSVEREIRSRGLYRR